MDPQFVSPVKIPYPKSDDLHLKINARVSSMNIAPGLGNAWVTGRYYDPKEASPIRIYHSEALTEINIGSGFSYRVPKNFCPRLNLSFGRQRPFSLEIIGGDISNEFDFGGFPLNMLTMRFGVGDQVINFSYPNPQSMKRFKIETDTGALKISNIANANAAELRVGGNSNHCRLDFSGELKQNMDVFIGGSVSNVEIIIPASTAAVINSSITPDERTLDGFCFKDNAYWTQPALDQQEPLLRIRSIAELGSFRLCLPGE